MSGLAKSNIRVNSIEKNALAEPVAVRFILERVCGPTGCNWNIQMRPVDAEYHFAVFAEGGGEWGENTLRGFRMPRPDIHKDRLRKHSRMEECLIELSHCLG